MAIPKTREELIEQGWRKIGSKTCDAKECGVALEMWRNPKTDRVSTMEVDPFTPHFALCPARNQFRKGQNRQATTGKLF
jgi:hypothetical protein